MHREFWQHKLTDTIWVVEFDGDGVVLRAAGPLNADGAQGALLHHLPLDARDVPWIKRERDHFAPLEARGTEEL